MADVKNSNFAKAMQKHAGRAKEKILQNLGKADKTTDDAFETFESNFGRQQGNASRLHKEIANYLRCARALHGASKSLFETLGEVYEPEWVGHDLLYAQSQNSDMLWTDFCHKIQDQTLTPLTAYVNQFPEIKKRIDKRGRKLVDYDSQRHQLEALQKATRRDEYKIARSRDTLETARTTYEGLNKELYSELPEIYDQRIANVASNLQTLFAAETVFMAETSKVGKELEAIAEKLVKECAKGTYRTQRTAAPRPLSIVEPKTSPAITKDKLNEEVIGRPYEEIQFEETRVNGTTPASTTTTAATTNGDTTINTKIPTGANREGLAPGVLYRVRATYKYTREDVDEIGFEVGDTIQVVEYEDPQDMEEGWLCGVKEATLEKGLFPANFTRPI